MNHSGFIPIVVGVTGHRDLRREDVPALEREVESFLTKLQTKYPHSPIQMLCSLAAGGDMLCARVAIRLGIALLCPLPKEEEEYKTDFSPAELAEYHALRSRAEMVFLSPRTEPELADKDDGYRQAGIYVATHCHVLLALWDGTAGTPIGCGTAEAVDFMRKGSYQHETSFRADNDGAVYHIHTPRLTKKQSFPVTAELLENEKGALNQVLTKTEQYNTDAQRRAETDVDRILPGTHLETADRLQEVYSAADRMSSARQKGYLQLLGILAALSVGLVLFYLLYDEAELRWCIVAYGVSVLLYGVFYRMIVRRMQHDKYLEYRALAETLRVQIYYSALGMDCLCGDEFTWTQKHELTWIREALSVLTIGPKVEGTASCETVKNIWIVGQREYHKKAAKRDGSNHRRGEVITRAMVLCTLLAYAVVLLLEYGAPSAMERVFADLSLRTWFKILWGCLSAVTVFASGYYGKLSLSRKQTDHRKMALLFEKAEEQYEKDPAHRKALFRQLGREELIENGNWVSYCRENGPDFHV